MTSTYHTVVCSDSRRLPWIPEGSIDLVVTSPPYPMIEMWDQLFAELDPGIEELLSTASGAPEAHERMHRQLDATWEECYRTLRPGGLLCVNVGDATRSIDGQFCLFSNHSRIITRCLAIGFVALPIILWRKQTNAPTKFMGSGMYPPGAYVTLEHEYILLFRKGGKREFNGAGEAENRRESAYFWEERNIWFSDLWDFKGSRQVLKEGGQRERSGAFPFELSFRLVSMFSVRGDKVLDPFVGTGTTILAAELAGRNSVGVEFEESLANSTVSRIVESVGELRRYQEERVDRHAAFAQRRANEGYPCGYRNRHHGFPVMTRQERDLIIDLPSSARLLDAVDSVSIVGSKQPRIEAPPHARTVEVAYRPFSSSLLPF